MRGPRLPRAPARLFRAGQLVQQVAGIGGVGQLALLVLALDRQQAGPDLFQKRHGGDQPVDQHAVAPLQAQLPPQHQDLVRPQAHPQTRQLVAAGWGVGKVEDAFDPAALLALPHQFLGHVTAAQQAEGARDHRLAGAGLAREHGQAGPERNRQLVHDRQLPDA